MVSNIVHVLEQSGPTAGPKHPWCKKNCAGTVQTYFFDTKFQLSDSDFFIIKYRKITLHVT